MKGEGDNLLKNVTFEREHMGMRWPKNEDLNGAAVGKHFDIE